MKKKKVSSPGGSVIPGDRTVPLRFDKKLEMHLKCILNRSVSAIQKELQAEPVK